MYYFIFIIKYLLSLPNLCNDCSTIASNMFNRSSLLLSLFSRHFRSKSKISENQLVWFVNKN